MSANLYITSCPHGLDLRVHPRCYLCKPATPEPPLDEGEPWQWIHDNGFTWDDVNALAAILEAGGYDIVPVAEPPLDPDLRSRVWQVLHDHDCDEQPKGHSWREHLPWDSEDDMLGAERLADALIVAILGGRP